MAVNLIFSGKLREPAFTPRRRYGLACAARVSRRLVYADAALEVLYNNLAVGDVHAGSA